jgi:acyl-CoA thioesterase-1
MFGLALCALLVFGAFLLQNQGGRMTAQAQASPPPPLPPVLILAFGDSLTAGLGLLPGKAYPELLQARLKASGYNARVINAGVSGDTTRNGLDRLDWTLEEAPDIAIVALGANDALRGLNPARSEANLDAVLGKIAAKGAVLLIAGMYAPRNMGPEYARVFDGIFPRLAAKYKAALYPFLLDGVAGDPNMNLPDGLHPNEAGAARIAEGLYPLLPPLIQQAQERKSKGAK